MSSFTASSSTQTPAVDAYLMMFSRATLALERTRSNTARLKNPLKSLKPLLVENSESACLWILKTEMVSTYRNDLCKKRHAKVTLEWREELPTCIFGSGGV